MNGARRPDAAPRPASPSPAPERDAAALSAEAEAVLAQATRLARGLGAPRAGVEHLVLALTATPGPPAFVLARGGVVASAVYADLADRAPRPTRPATDDPSAPDAAVARLIEAARALAAAAGRARVQPVHLLRAALDPDGGPAAGLLHRLGAPVDDLVRAADAFVGDLARSDAPASSFGAIAAIVEEWRLGRLGRRVARTCGARAWSPVALLDALFSLGPIAFSTVVFAICFVGVHVAIYLDAAIAPLRSSGALRAEDLRFTVAALTGNGILLALLIGWALPRTARWVLITRWLAPRADAPPLAAPLQLRLAGELILSRDPARAVEVVRAVAAELGVPLGDAERVDITTAFGVSGEPDLARRRAAWGRLRAAVRRMRLTIAGDRAAPPAGRP